MRRPAGRRIPKATTVKTDWSPAQTFALAVVVLVALVGALLTMLQTHFDGRIYPGVSTMGVDLGGYTPDEARVQLNRSLGRLQQRPVTLQYGSREWTVPAGSLGLRFQIEDKVAAAFTVGRNGSLFDRFAQQIATLRSGTSIAQPEPWIDRGVLEVYLRGIAKEVDVAPEDARLEIQPGTDVTIVPERVGRRLDVDASADRIARAIESLDSQPVDLVVVQAAPRVTAADLAPLKGSAERMLAAPLAVRYESQQWELPPEEIAKALKYVPATDGAPSRLTIDENGFSAFVQSIAETISRPPRNARIDPGPPARVIAPEIPGRNVDVAGTLAAIRTALESGEQSAKLTVTIIEPDVRADDIGKLANLVKVDEASTVYSGTLPDRMYNIELAASRLNGTVIGPGETFSFNDAVGEVSYRTGYKRGYGIAQQGDDVQTIPSEGGGICQVATTVFQAAFWAGYPIVERNWHLYWIPRYGQPPRGIQGLDATIDQVYDKNYNLLYAVDLQFKNPTENYIVLQARADGNDLVVSLFGAKPNWTVHVEDPVIDQRVKADPTPVYQVDRTITPGSQVMIEHAEDGFRATIVRQILRGGEVVRTDRFVSTYKPSRNVYLVNPAS